jgi:glutamate synthase domain-containing protein 2
MGLLILPGLVLLSAAAIAATAAFSLWWLFALVPLVLLTLLGVRDYVQREHSILRSYPVLGHMRFLLERIRPELQQYFIERNYDGRPYDRDTRTVIYQRAKGTHGEQAFGTERDVEQSGYEFVVHSACPREPETAQPRVRIGGPDCTKPYDMALLNVSAMSFGALSANAISALNRGAALGGFAHDSGEGGVSAHHRQGGDLIWEIGSGYFGARTADGYFDPDKFRDKAADPQIKCVELKLSQGAKPGIGGVLPGAKVTPEIAAIRGVPVGVKVISPPAHKVFGTPRELVLFIARMRELADGKPTGFKLCVGSRAEILGICKAMAAEGVTPDFIVVDGSEGGTGAEMPDQPLPGRCRDAGSAPLPSPRRDGQERARTPLPAGHGRRGAAAHRLNGPCGTARAVPRHADAQGRPPHGQQLRRDLRMARTGTVARRAAAGLGRGLEGRGPGPLRSGPDSDAERTIGSGELPRMGQLPDYTVRGSAA